MIRLAEQVNNYDMVPHAIFWRPLTYFSIYQYRDYDDLDYYDGISFDRGNRINFDLRRYDGHPKNTTSLYLPVRMRDLSEVVTNVEDIIEEMVIPKTAIGWQRAFSLNLASGPPVRTSDDRLTESEARIIALKIASLSRDHSASTEHLLKETPNYFFLTDADLEKSSSRKGEPVWKQIIRNVISHRGTDSSIFAEGYAIRQPNGLQVTIAGLNYLKSIGFSDWSVSPNWAR